MVLIKVYDLERRILPVLREKFVGQLKKGEDMESRLKEILDERGIKYSFIAKKAGIATSTMTNLVKGGLPTLLSLIVLLVHWK